MKRAILFIVVAAWLLVPLAAQNIVVQKPNGGEILTPKDAQGNQNTFLIHWAAKNISQKVKIVLLNADGSKFGLIKGNRDVFPAEYSWPIGQTVSGMAPAGKYRIRVATMDNSCGDVSDAPFVIQEPPPAPIKFDSLATFKKKTDISLNPGITIPVRQKPDLIVCKSGPGQLAQENLCEPTLGCFNFYLKIHNIGNAESKECWLKIAFNGGGSASGTVPAIKPGESSLWVSVINTQLDGSLADKYTVWIDEKNVVDEADEGNNILTGALSRNAFEPAKCSDGKAH